MYIFKRKLKSEIQTEIMKSNDEHIEYEKNEIFVFKYIIQNLLT